MDLETLTKIPEMGKAKKSQLFGDDASRGVNFDDLDRYAQIGFPAIRHIRARYKGIIDSIDFICAGQSFKHGGYGGDEIVFDLEEGEYVTKVEGTTSTYYDQPRIVTLTFHLNSGRTFKVPGCEPTHNTFQFSADKDGAICCMFGNADQFLNLIGFYDIPRVNTDAMPGGKPLTPA